MYVVIVGGGRTGTQLARMLIRQNHEVHIVESRRDVLSRLHRDIPTEMIHEGNEIDPRVLEIAGIQRADIIAAVTTNDEDNLVVCYISRNRYNVPRTIARVNNPRNAWLFNQAFHVDAAVNPSEIMSRLIEEEMSMKDMVVLAKLRRGNYSLVVEKISPGSAAIGRSILDLQLPDSSVIAALVREEKVVMPRGKTIFEVGDEIYAITDAEGAENLQKIFAEPVSTKNGR